MTAEDRTLAKLLDRLTPIVEGTGNWERVLGDAEVSHASPLRRRRTRRRWAIVVATAVLVALLVGIPALAVANDWWFLDHPGLTPVGDVAVVESGHVGDAPWYLVAFVSKEHAVCVALVSDPSRRSGAIGCGGPLRGAPDSSSDDARLDWLSYASTTWPEGGDGETFVWGPALPEVDRVDVILADGRVASTNTIAAPSLGVPLRFYVVHVAPGTVNGLVAYDEDGDVLERWELP
jgi:hypothetical protein